MANEHNNFSIRPATIDDVPLILQFIKDLADYEKLSDMVVATEELLRETLFGERTVAEVVIGYEGEQAAAFALFFHNYSTFLARPSLHLGCGSRKGLWEMTPESPGWNPAS